MGLVHSWLVTQAYPIKSLQTFCSAQSMGSLKPLVVAAAALQASKLPRNQTTGNR